MSKAVVRHRLTLPQMSLPILVLDVIVLFCAAVAALRLYRKRFKNSRSRSLRLPPGPKPSLIPLIGNMFDMPASRGEQRWEQNSQEIHSRIHALVMLEWLSFSAWRERYGMWLALSASLETHLASPRGI
jgi:hypothetical protein